MTEVIHDNMVEMAENVSDALTQAITANGAIKLRRRGHLPLGEVLCRTIAGQQLSVKAASSIWSRVVVRAADRAIVDYVNRARVQTLRNCGLSAAKVKAIKGIARADIDGHLDTKIMRKQTTLERTETFTGLWGVGQWTADMLNMFYFQDPDIWPDGDVAARKTLQRLTPRRRSTIMTAEHFAPYRTYLAMHMWQFADNTPE